jgi:proteasome lid subunit RPN8/RPN11
MDCRLEDFLVLTNININNNFYRQIKNYALNQSQEEVCGLIVLDNFGEVQVEPCENTKTDKSDGFIIDTKLFLHASKNKDILAIYHSHPDDPPDPSTQDLLQCEELCLPFIIYSVKYDDFYIHIPKSCPIGSFTQRRYVEGLQNCTVLAIDFYRKNYKFEFKNFDFNLKRQDLTWGFTFKTLLRAKNLFRDNGFKKVKNSEMKKDDLIIFQMGKSEIHFGICLDNDEFLHHPFYGLSQKSFFSEEIKNTIHSVYRKSVYPY